MGVIGRVYFALGVYQPAERLLSSAIQVREETENGDDLDVADTLDVLGQLLAVHGRVAPDQPQLPGQPGKVAGGEVSRVALHCVL